MDVTGGAGKQLSDAIGKLPAEIQPVFMALMDRIDQLETKTAQDISQIADKVIAALVPQAQALTQTVNTVADQGLTLIRELMARGVTIQLGSDQNK